MPEKDLIDISETSLARKGLILEALILDHSTGQNIIWATDSYAHRGKGYQPESQILAAQIIGENGRIIRPRASKSLAEQVFRQRDKGEVFTPLQVVAQMNLAADRILGRSKITSRNWEKIVDSRKMELACGEGPFIAGRYDPTATSQEVIAPIRRVGFLDRKFQAVNQFEDDETQWLKLARRALESTYGYEWQGDSLLIARENVLQTVIDFYETKFGTGRKLAVSFLEDCAEIVSWNLFQMDGIKCVIPMSCKDVQVQTSASAPLFGDPEQIEPRIQRCPGCVAGGAFGHNGKLVKIKDWETGEVFNFNSMLLQ